ncbi:hypothetical protein CVT24_012667 [Panaeolus cyanescens]|uniref:Uncharacterized protein n=1 Tax=Panaeolus cyanescens TaxID=181874 RepID=A0A409YKD1_9AGAR|nr:hypothetical protein CVT24_012667 [Panaeolus cyanescens]
MVNPGAFKGKRKEYMISRKKDYGDAKDAGTIEDCLAEIIQTYFRMFPPDRPFDYEPTDEEITENLEKEYTDPQLPDPDELNESEYAVEMGKWKERRLTIKAVKGAYQYLKDRNMVKKNLKGSKNGYASLMFQLSGKRLEKPRQYSAVSVWRRPNRKDIEAAARKRCLAEKKSLKTGLAPIREEIANTWFQALSVEEKEKYDNLAHEEHVAAMKQWKKDKKDPLTSDPESRQRCIANLPAVVQPLLDLIADATGWKVTLLAGGPCPARGGRMSMVNLHSGTTLGEVPMTFGRFEHVRYAKYLTPMFTNFLRKCYTLEECRERALPVDEDMPAFDEADENGPTFQVLDTTVPSEVDDTRLSRGNHAPSRPPSRTGSPLPVSQAPRPLPSGQDTAQTPEAPRSHSPSSQSLSHHVPSPAPESPPASPYRAYSREHSSPPDSPCPPPSPAPSRAAAPFLPVPPVHAAPPEHSAPQVPLQQPAPSRAARAALSTASTPEPQAAKAADSNRGNKRAVDDDDMNEDRRKVMRVDTGLEEVSQPKPLTRKGKGKGKKRALVVPESSDETVQPRWFLDSMQMFTEGAVGLGSDGNGSLGQEWNSLVRLWSLFQRNAGFSTDSKLPTANRPFPIKEWIGRARSPTYRPTISNVAEYESTYTRWWASMQPEWRIVNGKVDPKLVEGDWSSLHLPGQNGLVSVIVALFYWGLAAQDQKVRKNAWLRAVRNCNTAISRLGAAPSA